MVSSQRPPGIDRPTPSEPLSADDRKKIAAIQIQAADRRDQVEREFPRIGTAPRILGRDYRTPWMNVRDWFLYIMSHWIFIVVPIFIMVGVALVVTFITTFVTQSVVIAVILGMSFFLWRQFRRPLSGRDRLQTVQRLIHEHEYQRALQDLIPIAEDGYAPAQMQLAWMYEQGRGTAREPARAFRWYEAAARRGVPEAQYATGLRYAEGNGVKVDFARAIDWLSSSAGQGVAGAARRLGHLYETGDIGFPADRERAVEWYYRAGVIFLSRRQPEDAQAMVDHLRTLATGYPAVQALVTKLEQQLRSD